MYVDRTVEYIEIPVGNLEKQLLACLHAAGCFCKREEQVEFDGGELQSLTGDRRGASALTDFEIAHYDGLRWRRGRSGGHDRAANDSTQPGQQFTSRERLR